MQFQGCELVTAQQLQGQRPQGLLRVKVEFDDSIDLADFEHARRLLLPIPSGLSLVSELAEHLRARLAGVIASPLILSLDGFTLPPEELIFDLVRDGDLLAARESVVGGRRLFSAGETNGKGVAAEKRPPPLMNASALSTPPPAKRLRRDGGAQAEDEDVAPASASTRPRKGSERHTLAASPGLSECSPSMVAALDVALLKTGGKASHAGGAESAREEVSSAKAKERAQAALAAHKAVDVGNVGRSGASSQRNSPAIVSPAAALKAAKEAALASAASALAVVENAATPTRQQTAGSSKNVAQSLIQPGGIGGIKRSEDGTLVSHPLIGELEVAPGQDGELLVRRKLKTLEKAALKQVEHYFSDKNWARDEHMQSIADELGYVRIREVASFDRMATLVTDPGFIAQSLQGSKLLQLSPCANFLRRRPQADDANMAAPAAIHAASESALAVSSIPSVAAPDTRIAADSSMEQAQKEQPGNVPQMVPPSDAPTESAGTGGTTVFVGGLPWSCDETILQKDFSECGKIKDMVLLKDKDTGRSRGVAFITFEDKVGVEAALKFDGDDYGGRTINVKVAEAKEKGKGEKGKGKGKEKGKGKGKEGKGKEGKGKGPNNSVIAKGLSMEVTEADLRDLFKSCGQGPANVKLLINLKTGESKCVAFVDFDDQAGVEAAMKVEKKLRGADFVLDYSKPREG